MRLKKKESFLSTNLQFGVIFRDGSAVSSSLSSRKAVLTFPQDFVGCMFECGMCEYGSD